MRREESPVVEAIRFAAAHAQADRRSVMNTSSNAMLAAADGAGISIFMRQQRRSICFERLIDWARVIAGGVAPSPRYWFDANAASVGTSFHVAARVSEASGPSCTRPHYERFLTTTGTRFE